MFSEIKLIKEGHINIPIFGYLILDKRMNKLSNSAFCNLLKETEQR